jgi:hypothetical protein
MTVGSKHHSACCRQEPAYRDLYTASYSIASAAEYSPLRGMSTTIKLFGAICSYRTVYDAATVLLGTQEPGQGSCWQSCRLWA